jgi:DNA repair protein RadA/Sms
MKKMHTMYVCQSCAHTSARWLGRCPNCGTWNTFVEEPVPERRASRMPGTRTAAYPVPLSEVERISDRRLTAGIPELDRVLGGGIVPGSVVLVGGDPGIGKSTLMLQMAAAVAERTSLYVTGEESVQQMKLRADRLGLPPQKSLLVLAETSLDCVDQALAASAPDLIIVDSIQTMERAGLESAAGTVSQVRETAATFMRLAKTRGIPVFLVGHVTKEGAIAGPRLVEHMVDTVLQFEGEHQYAYRILRSVKNRFGSTNEIGIFEMEAGGLREVRNPSAALLAERTTGAPGSAVVAGLEGTRPLLLEVQALVAPASYGIPQRSATGFDTRRLQMLLAVLEKRGGLHVGQYDVFVNVAGGVRIDEPAADLGMALAIVSSLRDSPVDPESVAIGEVGLGGEIRRVHQAEKRITEAQKLGFRRVVLPARLLDAGRRGGRMEMVEVESVGEAIERMIGPGRG